VAVISVNADDFRNFQRTLKRMDKDISRELNKELRKVIASTIVPAARSNAGWSSRIPSAIKPTVGVRNIGARVASKQAPHGRAYEGLQKGLRSNSHFRHPVFGNRQVWVSQATRPFLAPAFEENAGEAVKAAEEAIQSAARAAGFK
jgi:hypothetical protein